jgi:Arc/MetJ family transcription regulator
MRGGEIMRTNIVIDDELMDEALKVTGLKTKRAVVEEGLKLLVKLRRQEQIRKLFGTLKREGEP